MGIISPLRGPVDIYKIEECPKSQIVAKQIEIEKHIAWHGHLSGLNSEVTLQKQPVGSYVLREGETENAYYLSWMSNTEQNICIHRPFCIHIEDGKPKWLHKNGQIDSCEKLEDIIPRMMHLSKESCFPVLRS